MDTKRVIECMLYLNSSNTYFYNSFKVCHIIDDNRNWNAVKHIELENILNDYKSPNILCIINNVITCFIIQSYSKRLYRVIQIIGNDCQFFTISKSKISSLCHKAINIKDFIPQCFNKSILWIPFQNTKDKYIDLIMFTEYIKNKWTIDLDLGNIIPKTSLNTTENVIIKNILSEI
jgi:hypothetical protein